MADGFGISKLIKMFGEIRQGNLLIILQKTGNPLENLAFTLLTFCQNFDAVAGGNNQTFAQREVAGQILQTGGARFFAESQPFA